MSKKEFKKAMKDLEIKQSYILALLVSSYSKIVSKKLSKEILECMDKNKDIIIRMYFIEKLRPIDISKKLAISKSAVTQVLQKDNRYLKEKEIRKQINRKNKHDYDWWKAQRKNQKLQFSRKIIFEKIYNYKNKNITNKSHIFSKKRFLNRKKYGRNNLKQKSKTKPKS